MFGKDILHNGFHAPGTEEEIAEIMKYVFGRITFDPDGMSLNTSQLVVCT